MRRVRSNIVANFAAQGWAALAALIVVPFYLRLLGPAAYGLIGLYVSLQLILIVLDLGLATTANREISRRQTGKTEDLPALVRTLEIIYLLTATVIALVLLTGAEWIATRWLRVGAVLQPAEVITAVRLIGLTIAARWPASLYMGVLRGREAQVLQNGIAIVITTLRTLGSLAVLYWIDASIPAFFTWQVVVSVVEVAALGVAAWRVLPEGGFQRGRFKRAVLASVWRFSWQLSLVALFAAALKQMDKILLSRLVSLDLVGYYVAAASLAAGLLLFATPVSTALFPRFSALFAEHRTGEVRVLYERSLRLVAAMAAPAAAILVFFGREVLAVWTRSDALAATAGPVLAVLAAAMLLNALMQVPYALQIAAGHVDIALWTNGIGVLLLAPLTVYLVGAHGMTGAGIAWLLFNIAYAGGVSAIVERRALGRNGAFLLWRHAAPAMLVALIWFGAARLLARAVPAAWPAWVAVGAAGYGLTILRSRFAPRGLAGLRTVPETSV